MKCMGPNTCAIGYRINIVDRTETSWSNHWQCFKQMSTKLSPLKLKALTSYFSLYCRLNSLWTRLKILLYMSSRHCIDKASICFIHKRQKTWMQFKTCWVMPSSFVCQHLWKQMASLRKGFVKKIVVMTALECLKMPQFKTKL